MRYIEAIGVEEIQKHSQSLIEQLRREVPRLGHELITPADATGPIVAFQLTDPGPIAARLKRAKVDVTISDHRMRVSPSVYNGDRDIERFLQVLSS